jgi:hypothetical protein
MIVFDGSWPVPVPHARPITLSAAERRRLTTLAYSHTAAYQQVIRARIIRDAARAHANAAIRLASADEKFRDTTGRIPQHQVIGLEVLTHPAMIGGVEGDGAVALQTYWNFAVIDHRPPGAPADPQDQVEEAQGVIESVPGPP